MARAELYKTSALKTGDKTKMLDGYRSILLVVIVSCKSTELKRSFRMEIFWSKYELSFTSPEGCLFDSLVPNQCPVYCVDELNVSRFSICSGLKHVH